MKKDRALLVTLVALATFACAGLIPAAGAGGTPTATAPIGAIEVGTPGLKGDKKDYRIWTGTITSQTSRQFMSNGALLNTCNTNWVTDLDVAVDSAGNLTGTGRAALAEARSCTSHSNLVANTAEMALSIQGQKDSTAFHLNLTGAGIKPSPSGDFGGYALLFGNQACPPQRRTIEVPLTADSTAETQLDLSSVMTGCGGSRDDTVHNLSLVKFRFRFLCSDLPADLNDPTLRSLCG
jgi:hypothetical protein